MWIENCSMMDILKAYHHDPGPNSMVIQIVDPDMEFPIPKYPFKEKRALKFLDIEDKDCFGSITDLDAQNIADALTYAKKNKMNVVVHCVAGICRSGAVVEAGQMVGFEPVDKYRIPNVLVKNKIIGAVMASIY